MEQVFQRSIVIRLPNGNDYVHTFPVVVWDSIAEFIKANGEHRALHILNRAIEIQAREHARYDAKSEVREVLAMNK